MRDEWAWEKDIRRAWRHRGWHGISKVPNPKVTLRVSPELGHDIQQHNNITINIDISKNGVTWQGIPLRLDASLPPGCFIFDEGESNGND